MKKLSFLFLTIFLWLIGTLKAEESSLERFYSHRVLISIGLEFSNLGYGGFFSISRIKLDSSLFKIIPNGEFRFTSLSKDTFTLTSLGAGFTLGEVLRTKPIGCLISERLSLVRSFSDFTDFYVEIGFNQNAIILFGEETQIGLMAGIFENYRFIKNPFQFDYGIRVGLILGFLATLNNENGFH